MKRPIILSVEALDTQLTGIGRYVWELAQRLPAEHDIGTVRFLRNGEWIPDPTRLIAGTVPPRRPKHIRWLRNRTKTLRRLTHEAVLRWSLCHGPNFFLPAGAEGGVVTIHDLSVFRYPETHPAARLAHFEQDFASTLRRAARIITVSETVRQEVIDFTGFAPDHVSTIYQGVAAGFHPRSASSIMPVLAGLGLEPDGYALCVSTIEPRKRIGQLVTAWRRMPAAVRSRWPLVVAGSSGWLSDDILQAMEAAEREGWLRYIRYVPEADLPSLYAGARLFVYPSAYEGFGLPPIEAMASGVPAIVSDASCLPEVTAGAAMLTQPDDIDRFAADLERGLLDDDWRRIAVHRGIAVAGGYRWDRCARETARLYRHLS